MAFQLVLVTDSEITVWHTEFGHIYGFGIDDTRESLLTRFTRDVPEAGEPAALHQESAHAFAIALARGRRLITS